VNVNVRIASLVLAAVSARTLSAQAPIKVPVESFVPVVGDWQVVEDGGKKVLRVDGRTWKRGNPAAGLADKARAIYGSKHEEFIDNVKAFAYFPYAVAPNVPDFTDGELRVRFKLIGGALDQCAGILFDLKPNGDYFTVRFNQKEDNLVLWIFKNGKRSFVKKNVHDVPLPMNEWHSIRLKFTGKGQQMEAFLDDEKLIDYTFENGIAGKVGVWSKTDSVSAFDGYEVSPAK
jgi:hypothetical protein